MRGWKLTDIAVAWGLAAVPVAILGGVIAAGSGTKWPLFAGAIFAVVPVVGFFGYFLAMASSGLASISAMLLIVIAWPTIPIIGILVGWREAFLLAATVAMLKIIGHAILFARDYLKLVKPRG